MNVTRVGFTVVELMVTVAIVSVLAAVAVPFYRSYEAHARQAEVKTSLTSAFTAEKSFFLQNQHYTACLAAAGYSPESQYYSTGFGNDLETNAESGGYIGSCVNDCDIKYPISDVIQSTPQNDLCVQDCNNFFLYKISYTSENSGHCDDVDKQTYFQASRSVEDTTPAVRDDLPPGSTILSNQFTLYAAGLVGFGALDQWSIDQDKNLVTLGFYVSNEPGNAGNAHHRTP